jgi:hypothetical protein
VIPLPLKVVHYIVDYEKNSSRSNFNMQYGIKLTISLFVNTAILSYVTDIILLGNVIGQGGSVCVWWAKIWF